jgi:amidohydrolase
MNTIKTTILYFTLLQTCSFQLFAQNDNYSALIANKADEIEQKVINWRHDIHQHPELVNREFRTAELIAKHLQSLGIETQTKVGFTDVVGILKGDKPGPVIALRADMDALPVVEKNDLPFASKVKTDYNGKETSVMHAYGHDAHVAILMGVAEVSFSIKKDLKGTVKFIFQPAEEGAPKGEEGGAALMIKEGVLNDPNVDVIFGLHIVSDKEVGKIMYRPGGLMAGVADFKITVLGKPSHDFQPWTSVDPILVAAQIVTSLQQIISRNVNLSENPAVISIGTINGGNRSNIIPTQVELLGDVRAFNNEDENLIYTRIKQIAEKTAEAAGAKAIVKLPYMDHYPLTFNDLELTKNMLPSLQKSASIDNVKLVTPGTGAEDFSFFAQKVPGMYFGLGGMTKGQDLKTAGPHQTPEFIIDDAGLKTGVIAFCNLIFDYGKLNKK